MKKQYSRTKSQLKLDVITQGRLTVRVQNLMNKYDSKNITSKNIQEKNLRLAHKITDNYKEPPFRDNTLQDMMSLAFSNNGEIRAAMFE